MVINVRAVVGGGDTTSQGLHLHRLVTSALSEQEGVITLDFSGVPSVTSSFINASLVRLIEEFGPEYVKVRVKLVGLTRQSAGMVRYRTRQPAA